MAEMRATLGILSLTQLMVKKEEVHHKVRTFGLSNQAHHKQQENSEPLLKESSTPLF